jgi:glycosyltransferase involved in cell wall biosynthesis
MNKKYNSDAIIHVVSSLEVGGAERFVIDLCQLQKAKGCRAAILSFGKKTDPLVLECEKVGIRVYHTRNNRIHKWIDALSALFFYNTIHFHSPYPLKFLLPVMPICWIKNVIYTRHGADPLAGPAWKTMHIIANFFVKKINFVSQEGADVFERSHGWKNKIKKVIDNGVNLADVSLARFQSDLFRIGSVGRMVPLKNQISLLEAINVLDEEHKARVEVHFFGNGPSLPILQNFVENNHLQDRVVFHGMVSDRSDIYNSFDALAVTSETEGLSLAIMEAMAYHCPILASDVGGNSKLVSNGVNGFLFEYNNVENLSISITTMMDETEQFQIFAKNSREKVEQQFSLASSADKYEKLYNL